MAEPLSFAQAKELGALLPNFRRVIREDNMWVAVLAAGPTREGPDGRKYTPIEYQVVGPVLDASR